MSKIYDALQLAQRERKGIERRPPASAPDGSRFYADLAVESGMYAIYRNISLMLPKPAGRVVQFLGALEGEGTSTIVRLFARIAATLADKPVLLLDADRGGAGGAGGPGIPFGDGRDVLRKDEESDDVDLYRVGESQLFLCPFSEDSGTLLREVYSSDGSPFLERFRRRFELVFIDSPPAAVSPDGVALAGKADGVILVIEADRTRWPVAEKLKEEILKNGGNILGVVLNKRRYYIPEFLYRKL